MSFNYACPFIPCHNQSHQSYHANQKESSCKTKDQRKTTKTGRIDVKARDVGIYAELMMCWAWMSRHIHTVTCFVT